MQTLQPSAILTLTRLLFHLNASIMTSYLSVCNKTIGYSYASTHSTNVLPHEPVCLVHAWAPSIASALLEFAEAPTLILRVPHSVGIGMNTISSPVLDVVAWFLSCGRQQLDAYLGQHHSHSIYMSIGPISHPNVFLLLTLFACASIRSSGSMNSLSKTTLSCYGLAVC